MTEKEKIDKKLDAIEHRIEELKDLYDCVESFNILQDIDALSKMYSVAQWWIEDRKKEIDTLTQQANKVLANSFYGDIDKLAYTGAGTKKLPGLFSDGWKTMGPANPGEIEIGKPIIERNRHK